MEINKEILLEEYNFLLNKLAEINLIKKILEDFSAQEESYINIGNFIFAKAKIIDDKRFLVNIGEKIFIEKDKEEIIRILEENKKKLEERIKEIENILKR
ncbi:MAG: prefoldin subunit alpha [Nanopusillaceae archaeon]